MRIYGLAKRADIGDRFADMRDEYEKNEPARSNLYYGYINQAA